MESLVGLALLGIVGLTIGIIYGFLFHSGGGNTGGMLEGVFWISLGIFTSIVIFLFIGLKDSGVWLIELIKPFLG
jgi:uncharacterized membrane protein